MRLGRAKLGWVVLLGLLALGAPIAEARTTSLDSNAPGGGRDAADPTTAVGSVEEAVATVTVEPTTARIGDRIRVTAKLAPEMLGAGAPALTIDEKVGPFRVLEVAASGDAVVVTVTPQETGDLELPGFVAEFKAPTGGPPRRARVAAIPIVVRSVLAEGDGTTIADLKPPADFQSPWPWKLIIAAALGAAALIAAAVWLVRRLRRPRAPRPVPEQALPPGVTPDAWAREALARLLAQGLVEAGRLREFHIELADLLRRYVELRFRVPALERTTEEIGTELARALVGDEASSLAAAALEACDRVKFAKHRPLQDEVAETIERFRRLVDRTVVAPAQSAAALPAAVPDGLIRPGPA